MAQRQPTQAACSAAAGRLGQGRLRYGRSQLLLLWLHRRLLLLLLLLILGPVQRLWARQAARQGSRELRLHQDWRAAIRHAGVELHLPLRPCQRGLPGAGRLLGGQGGLLLLARLWG